MAFGIFASASLAQLPVTPIVTRLFASLVLVLWLAIALMLLRSLWRDGIAHRVRPLLGSFAIGTWVASSALMAGMGAIALPEAVWLEGVFFAIALAVWLCYMPLAVANLLRLARDRQQNVTGSILLATVATQSLVMPLLQIFPDRATRYSAAALIALGALCYLLGALIVLRRFTTRRFSLARDWDNANCILHGALSITGLAAVTSGLFAAPALLSLWLAACGLFLLVEAIEIARAAARLRLFGWRRGLLCHDVSQWARNFTFGMFYAFTLALAQHAATAPAGLFGRVQALVLSGGPYLVLLLLVCELGLLAANARSRGAACR